MSNDFSFSDLGRVQWGPTIKLAVARGFFSGCVFAILIISLVPGPKASSEVLQVLFTPIAWGLLALPMVGLLYVFGKVVSSFIPLFGIWTHLITSLMICAGDPIIFFINKQFPALFNVSDLRIVNFRPMIFVTDPD